MAFYTVFPTALDMPADDYGKLCACTEKASVWLQLVRAVSSQNMYFIRMFREEHHGWCRDQKASLLVKSSFWGYMAESCIRLVICECQGTVILRGGRL